MLRVSPERLAELASGEPDLYNEEELKQYRLMLAAFEYIGEFPGNPLEDTIGSKDFLSGTGHFYRCRHVQSNGDCGVYRQPEQPDLCRTYPNGHPCMYKHCTWDEGRQPLIPAHRLLTGLGLKRALDQLLEDRKEEDHAHPQLDANRSEA